MQDAYIQSRHNDQVKNLVKLRERKHRDRQGRFLIEGLRELDHALRAHYAVDTIYYCPEYFPSDQQASFIDQIRQNKRAALVRMHKDAFVKAAYRQGPDGMIATARQQRHSLDELHLPIAPLLLMLEGIEKPGNLGAILRSADAAGVDAVILVDCVLDLYNPNAIRSSQGLIFAVPIICTEQAYLDEWLTGRQIHSVATTPSAQTLHWDIDYQTPTVLCFGSERDGLSEHWRDRCTEHIRIPMAGQADSLNVAAAVAICLYEAKRQRSNSHLSHSLKK